MQAIVSGAGLEKAPVISLVLRIGRPKIPGSKIAPKENIATMSGGIHSLMKASPASIRTIKTRIMSQCWLKILISDSTLTVY
tara:strand:- start:428 stop:673 length:246 start_codon:yes stop_codon:yes gene_type:complete